MLHELSLLQKDITLLLLLKSNSVRPIIITGSALACTVVRHMYPRNSSGDEIANVDFLYHDIVHAQNTIDSCCRA